MNKYVLLSALLICTFSISASAQSERVSSVKATIVEKESGEALAGAVFSLSPIDSLTPPKHHIVTAGGTISIPNVEYGSYTIKVSFTTFEDVVQNIEVDGEVTDLGKIELSPEPYALGEVFIEGQAMRTSQRGDTTIYNAAAFKVTKDADLEALLSKMPGIKIVDGKVEAQGEEVKKIFVDGKEFFDGDVNTAIKTLPAEAAKKVEVYNKLSDKSELSGVDDGEGYKAINIVTEIQKAQFGKVYAGYGFNDKYIGGLNINIFSGEHRFSIVGQANNMNQQNFSMEDILGAVSIGGGSGGRHGGGRITSGFMIPRLEGKSTIQSFGVNYMGKWGKKLNVTGSYSFNNSKNTNTRETERQYFDPEWLYDAQSSSINRNNEHRVNARLEYKFNDNHTLMMRPSVSFQNYKSDFENASETNDIGTGTPSFVNGMVSSNDSKNWGYNISNNIMYRVKLGKPGRTLSADIGGSLNKNDRKGISYNELQYAPPRLDSISGQRNINGSNNYSVNGRIMYTEPVSEFAQVNAQYTVSYRYADIDQKTYLWDEVNADYDNALAGRYSSIYNSGYITHRVGPGFNYSKDRNMFVANVLYQRSTLSSNQEYPSIQDIEHSFDNITYFAMVNRTFNPATTMRIFARSSTNNPSVTQLQNVVDISNPQFVSAGNPTLRPAYSNMAFANFVRTNVAKGRTFMVNARASFQSNYIGDNVALLGRDSTITLPTGDIVVLEKGSQFTKSENMSGYWSVGAGVSYGFPIKLLKSNLNLNANTQYAETPSIMNNRKNTLSSQYYSVGAVLGSNISENIDFTLSYNGGYNIANNSIRNDYNNEYLSQSVSLRFKWIAWAGFTLSGNVAYTQYKGVTDSYNDQYVMCNLFIGKKVFKNQRGEITFGVNDMFNQKSSFTRNLTNEYIENVKNNVMGRYFGVQFIYTLRNFGKAPAPSTLKGGTHRLGGQTITIMH